MRESILRGGCIFIFAGVALGRLFAGDLVSLHSRDPRDLALLFAAFDRAADMRTNIWSNHEWAIEIVQMDLDGKRVAPTEIVIVHSNPNLSEVVVQSGGQFVYRVSADGLMFHKSDDRYLKFSIEGVPDRIRVTYRIRYPSGEVSEPMVTESLVGVPRDQPESFIQRGRSTVVPASPVE